MSYLEEIFYVFFTVLIMVFLIGLFFYNKRHSSNVKKIKRSNYYSTNKDEIIEFKRNKIFQWDLYKSDISVDERGFLGFDIWESENFAKNRVDELKCEFQKTTSVLLYMVEMFLIIEDYGENITLNKKGEFVIPLSYLSNFILNLTYDIAMIRKVESLKKD